MSDEKNGNGSAVGLLRGVPARSVVALLLAGLLAVLLFVGAQYDSRLAALEVRAAEQDRTLERIRVDVEWIRRTLDK